MIGLRPLVERRKFRISAKLSPCAARECLDHVLTTPWVRVRLRKISVLPPHAQIGAHTHTHIYNMHVRRNTRFALHVGSNIYKSRKVFGWKLSWWCWDSLSCWDLFDWKVIKIFLSFSLFSQENDHFHTLQGIDYCWICVGSERNADWKCREKKRLSSPRIRKINK